MGPQPGSFLDAHPWQCQIPAKLHLSTISSKLSCRKAIRDVRHSVFCPFLGFTVIELSVKPLSKQEKKKMSSPLRLFTVYHNRESLIQQEKKKHNSYDLSVPEVQNLLMISGLSRCCCNTNGHIGLATTVQGA